VKFELKDYQADAVADVLEGLDTARLLASKGKTSSLALTAPTGAGKTVMAAAIIEALFFGDDDRDVLPDPTATVLWFTSDPALNEQTRFRMMQASDRIASSRLRVIESSFAEERLRPGTVYFLNSQKLGKNALLVRGAGAGEAGEMLAAPDMRARTFWEILANTIGDESTTLYVVLDEAHVGMRRTKRQLDEKSTIVKQLVNGEAGAPAVPIVLGISATVQRFRDAMAEAAGRTNLPDVAVDPARVQESGLLKDQLILSFPAETGQFNTSLLRHAVARTVEASTLWASYHEAQSSTGTPVLPLLVVQMPNTPTAEQLLEAVAAILAEWPELIADNIAHVFGEHSALQVGPHEIAYVAPQDVEESSHIRVLLAKDAVSTGWDCPRAEVLMSFRPASDDTHITQLLGRMVRTPLARRISGDDRLNAVECILPLFDRAAAERVVLALTSPDSEEKLPITVEFETAPFGRNKSVEADVWKVFDQLPSQTVPRRGGRPVSRFTAFAAALARDGLRPRAHGEASAKLVDLLRGKAVQYEEALRAQVDDVLQVDVEVVVAEIASSGTETREVLGVVADDSAIEAEYRNARRILTPQIAAAYADVLEDEYQDGYYEAHLRTAALARVEGVAADLDAEAERLFADWDAEHRVAIKSLSDERRAVYAALRELAGSPIRVDIQRPQVRIEPIANLEGEAIERAPRHLLADNEGNFPIGSLLGWERAVLAAELDRCVAWYRNPSRASTDALSIAYRDAGGSWRRLCPDFVFFEKVQGAIRPSIVDPHGVHLADALPKLRGLADYAENFAADFHRIEAVAEVGGVMKVLDLTDAQVRVAVRDADDVTTLYASAAAY